RTLAELGLLLRQEVGRQVHYRANPESPVYEELAGLLRKTAGVADVLREALAPLGDKIAFAFVYGSLAAGTQGSGSDVDLMVLGSAGFADLARTLAGTRALLKREVNPTVMTPRQFKQHLAEGDGFARSVWRGPKLWLIGDEHDLGKPAAHRKA